MWAYVCTRSTYILISHLCRYWREFAKTEKNGQTDVVVRKKTEIGEKRVRLFVKRAKLIQYFQMVRRRGGNPEPHGKYATASIV